MMTNVLYVFFPYQNSYKFETKMEITDILRSLLKKSFVEMDPMSFGCSALGVKSFGFVLICFSFFFLVFTLVS